MGYVDDVPSDGGGFTIWPGSHKHFYPTFKTAYTFNPLDKEKEYWDTDAWPSVAEIDPVQTYGSAGDVVLWHHTAWDTAPATTGPARSARPFCTTSAGPI